MNPVGSIIAVYAAPAWWWAIPLVVAVGGVLVMADLLRQRNHRGAAAVVGFALFGFWAAWRISTDTVTLTDQGVWQRNGFFGEGVVGFAFSESKNVVLETRPHHKHAIFIVEWVLNDGMPNERRFDPGDLWDIHQQEIVAEGRKMGVQFIERRVARR
jgi:hypothetical protein